MGDLKDAKRIVVKIGTNTLAGPDGAPDLWFLAAIADDVAALRAAGREVIIVSSGAIGAGRAVLGMTEKPREVRLRQAAAAAGQSRLMQAWDSAFARHGIPVAQLLLTDDSFSNRRTFVNLKNATETLLELGAVPIANENDTVSIAEIVDFEESVTRNRPTPVAMDSSFGDNDRLSALVASKAEADALVILSDVAGLYTRPPGQPGAELVPEIQGEVTPEIEKMASARPGSGSGRGGMASKIAAARVAMDAGVTVVIAAGREPHVLQRILVDGDRLGTRFVPHGREQGRKRWLAIAQPRGRIHVDAGAAAALRAGKHLLPAGIIGVEGVFDVESVVDIVHDKTVIARANSGYGSHELDQVKGLQSDAVRETLGFEDGSVNVTRKGAIVVFD